MKRKTLSILTAVAAAALVLLSSCTSKPAQKTIGIQLYSVMSAMKSDPAGSIERLASYGYNAVELVQWGGDTTVFGMSAPDFKALCDKHGVSILSTHSSVVDVPEKEDSIMNAWRSLFSIQKSLGGKYFVIPSYPVEYTEAGIKAEAEYFNKVGALAQEYGLQLGYHNHHKEFDTPVVGSDLNMWETLAKYTDPDKVFFELDVYWSTVGGQDPVELLKKYPERIKMLHVKDDLVIGESGKIDFEAVFNQFYANGMKDYVVEIETLRSWREEVDAEGNKLTEKVFVERKFDAAAKSAEFLKNAAFVK